MKRELLEKILGKRCVVGVLGLGYVGLPIAALFASRGFRVLGGDVRREVVEGVNKGQPIIEEKGLGLLVREGVEAGRLRATLDLEGLVRESDVVFVVVQTPIDEAKRPDLRVLEAACRTVAKGLGRGKLVVLESTIPPGTVDGLVVPTLESSGLKAGADFYLAYSPERAIPTRTLEEIQENGRVVGGVDEASAALAVELYRHLTSGELVAADVRTAEVVKVIENTYRDVNIALANEIALFCERLGVDALEAIRLANMHPRVDILLPGPGVGGHCIPKDPYFLLHKAQELGLELSLVKAARARNEAMPEHVFRMVEEALGSVEKEVRNSKVSILGVAYKGGTDDVRATPSEGLIKRLMAADCQVFSHDPYAKRDFGGKFSNRLEEAVAGADCVVIMTDHEQYRCLDMAQIARLMKKPGVIVDGRRVLDPETVKGQGIGYFGIGL